MQTERKTVTVAGIVWTIFSANERSCEVAGRSFFASRPGAACKARGGVNRWTVAECDRNPATHPSFSRVGPDKHCFETKELGAVVALFLTPQPAAQVTPDKATIRAIRKSIDNARNHCQPETEKHLDDAADALDRGEIEDARIHYAKAQAAQIYYSQPDVRKRADEHNIKMLKQHRQLCIIEAFRWRKLVNDLAPYDSAAAVDIRERARQALVLAEAGITTSEAELALYGVTP